MKVKRLIIGIIIFIIGTIFAFAEVINFLPNKLITAGIPLVSLSIFLIVYSFKWKAPRDYYETEELPQISKEEKIKMLYYSGLNHYQDNILRLFYNYETLERLIIYKYNGFVKIAKETLEIFDDEELRWTKKFGMWIEVDGGFSYYADEQLALNDIKNQLHNYEEINKDKITGIILNNDLRLN